MAHDLFSIEPTNDDLEVWLLHGNNDETVSAYVAHRFVARLAEHGIPGVVLTTDWAHAEPLDPAEPAGEYAAEQISSIVHGAPGAVWTATDAVATLSFDDERCEYAGPSSLERGRERRGGDQRFVFHCHPDPDADHPRPNWMYPAAVLTPADAAS